MVGGMYIIREIDQGVQTPKIINQSLSERKVAVNPKLKMIGII